MSKRMRVMLISLGILFGCIFLFKAFISLMIRHAIANNPHLVYVSTMKVKYEWWQPKLSATGSLRAINGVNVTTELAGMVQNIYFEPGSIVKEGTLLVQLNADAEIGQLQSLKANLELAKITYRRDKAQYAAQAISKQTLDTDEQNMKSLQGQVAQQAAIVAKKSIVAPFAGRLGINLINKGQYLNPGDTITMLQTLDPIYADFYIPQQSLAKLKVGQVVNLTSDTFPHETFTGKITTINPGVDSNTRNVQVEATLANPRYRLAPGMFALVAINIDKPKRYLTLPQTAISFNPYGEIVYVIESSQDKKGNSILTAKQRFVKTGETRGDQITILQGLKENDLVVTSGQLKLKNGSQVVINNRVMPPNNPNPAAPNEH